MGQDDQIEGQTLLKFALLAKTCLFELLKFPCYSDSKLRGQLSQLDQKEIQESDLQAYAETSSRIPINKRWRLMSSIYTVLYIAKNMSILCITFNSVDTNALWMSINTRPDMKQGNSTYIFSVCFYSNCTQSSRPYSSAPKDMRYFPVIPICYPHLSRLYPPTIWIPPYSFILHVIACTALFFVTVLLPLYTYWKPTPCDALMFLQAPKLTIQMMEVKAKNVFISLRRSYRTFRRRYQNFDDYDLAEFDAFDIKNSSIKRPKGYDAYTDTCGEHDLEQWISYKSDCLPRIRSARWRNRGSQILSYSLCTCFGICWVSFAYLSYDIYVRCLQKFNEHYTIRDELVRGHCKQFRLLANGSHQSMEPDEWLPQWSTLSLVDSIINNVVVIVCSMMVSTYFLMVTELNDWRAELVEQYDILSEATWVLIYELGSGRSMAGKEPKQLQLTYCRKMSIVKLLDIAETHIVRIKNMVPVSDESQQSLIKLDTIFSDSGGVVPSLLHSSTRSCGAQGFERYLTLMEKYYVSFRLFHSYVRRCATSTMPLTIISHALSYSLIGVAVWHSRVVGKFLLEHTVIIAANCCFTLSLIVVMSNFHAKVSSAEKT